MFDHIVGNEWNKEFLEKSIREKSYSHAYLFCGPSGIQKTDMAMAFAQGIFCTAQENRPCGICPSCVKINKGNHPDLHIIQPEEDKKSVLIQQVRQMQRNIAIKGYEGERKVYILRKAETMGDPAQNAMLKVLEEPEEGTILILVANSKSSILPTILSRCQILNFAPMSFAQFSKEWSQRESASREELEALYDLTQGKYGEALQLKDDPKTARDFQQIVSHLDQVVLGDLDKVFDITAYAAKQHMGDIELTDYLLIYFRNRMLASAEAKKSEGLTIGTINGIIEAILQFQNNIKSNLNMALQVENLLLKIQEADYGRSSGNTF